MADKSKIEWTDATWNPIVGCSVVSPACTNCYAMAQAARIQRMTPGSHYEGTTKVVNGKPVWTGVLKQAPEHILTAPLRKKKPRKIFVNSMSDLFHESVPDEWIDRIFAIMALAPQHTFQVLTKRPKRMRDYLTSFRDDGHGFLTRYGEDGYSSQSNMPPDRWPLPNVWLGVTAEDQTRADERRDDLKALAEQGWTTFVSYEPALGLVDWSGWEFVKQIICGGESGPGARPLHPDWARSLRDQCAAAGVPFFFKQWGEWAPESSIADDGATARCRYGEFHVGDGAWIDSCLCSEGAPGGQMFRVGKPRAGRLLDGHEHDEFPEVKHG